MAWVISRSAASRFPVVGRRPWTRGSSAQGRFQFCVVELVVVAKGLARRGDKAILGGASSLSGTGPSAQLDGSLTMKRQRGPGPFASRASSVASGALKVSATATYQAS